MNFRCMLSPQEDPLSYADYFNKLKYPLLASPKYDGIRCNVKGFTALSRTAKPLPSLQVQDLFSHYEHFDGEIIEGRPNDFDVYNRTQSHVMSANKPGDLHYYVFDFTHPEWLHKPFYQRLDILKERVKSASHHGLLHFVEHQEVNNSEELLEFENKVLEDGFEGIMMRNPIGHYKQGRGTFKEGLIYKLKRFNDSEAVIVDFVEQMENTNVQSRDELGYSKRSTSKEGLIPANTLGRFIVDWNGVILDIAPGTFNHDMRKKIWNNKDYFLGKILKFRYFNHGIKDKPRFPRAVGFRDRSDM